MTPAARFMLGQAMLSPALRSLSGYDRIGAGYGTGGWTGGPIDIDVGPPRTGSDGSMNPARQRWDQQRARAQAAWLDRLAQLGGLHSSARSELVNSVPGSLSVGNIRELISLARRGGVSDFLSRPAGVVGGRPNYGATAEDALRTLEADFAPLRAARAAFDAARQSRANPQMIREARRDLRQVRRETMRAERRGLTRAELAERRGY